MNTNDDNIVVAATFDTDTQAHLVIGVLEANGINAMIDNEIVTTLLPFLPPGYRVLVNKADLERASQIIAGMKLC